MAQSPEELRREIEQTRQDMSRNVDAIQEKVSPGRIVQRRVERAKGGLGSLRERIMGPVSSVKDTALSMKDSTMSMKDSASSGVSSVGDRAGSVQSSVTGAVSGAPEAAISRTQGNPLTAGLIAFGAGYLLAGLLPASSVEESAVSTLEDKVKEPLKEELSSVASDMKDGLQGSAQEAVQSVKETATSAAQTVAEQGKESADTVRSQAQGAADGVRGSTGSGSTS